MKKDNKNSQKLLTRERRRFKLGNTEIELEAEINLVKGGINAPDNKRKWRRKA